MVPCWSSIHLIWLKLKFVTNTCVGELIFLINGHAFVESHLVKKNWEASVFGYVENMGQRSFIIKIIIGIILIEIAVAANYCQLCRNHVACRPKRVSTYRCINFVFNKFHHFCCHFFRSIYYRFAFMNAFSCGYIGIWPSVWKEPCHCTSESKAAATNYTSARWITECHCVWFIKRLPTSKTYGTYSKYWIASGLHRWSRLLI